MATIVVYGSLINQNQLQKMTILAEACPVLVKGYKRVFNQEPSWRKGYGEHRAVLSAMLSAEDCFNGLLVGIQDDRDFHMLDERESGYDRTEIARSQLSCFIDTSCSLQSEPIYIYLGKPSKRNDDILPNKSYLDLCLRGAKHWGETFYDQFLQTTHVGTRTLKMYL